MDPAPVAEIASHGLLGVMLVIVGWVAWRKDRELLAEKQARIDEAKARVEDAQNFTKLALDLHAKVIDAVNKLAAILDEIKQMNAQSRGRS